MIRMQRILHLFEMKHDRFWNIKNIISRNSRFVLHYRWNMYVCSNTYVFFFLLFFFLFSLVFSRWIANLKATLILHMSKVYTLEFMNVHVYTPVSSARTSVCAFRGYTKGARRKIRVPFRLAIKKEDDQTRLSSFPHDISRSTQYFRYVARSQSESHSPIYIYIEYVRIVLEI